MDKLSVYDAKTLFSALVERAEAGHAIKQDSLV